MVPPAWFAKRYDALREEIGPQTSVLETWTPEQSIAEMDANGITSAVLSLTTPAVWSGDIEADRDLARQCNEYGAELIRTYPDRFGVFAAIPMPDIDGSLAEIEYALDVLHLDGVSVLSGYGGAWPGDAIYAPIFDELDRRESVVFFHPAAAACCSHAVLDIPAPIIEFEFNLTRAAASLVFGGTLTRFPKVKYLFAHAAGAVTVLATRMATTSYARRPDVSSRLPNGVIHELKKLYFECNSVVNPPGMAALLAFAEPGHVMLGTDFPIIPASVTLSGLYDLHLPLDTLEAIERNAAGHLFPRLARRPLTCRAGT